MNREPREGAADLGDHVGVRELDALRRSGRAGGVDVREEVILRDRALGRGQNARMLGGEPPAFLCKSLELRERDHLAKARQLVSNCIDLRPLLVVLDEDTDRLGVVENVTAVCR
jgi:hypothetical protein